MGPRAGSSCEVVISASQIEGASLPSVPSSLFYCMNFSLTESLDSYCVQHFETVIRLRWIMKEQKQTYIKLFMNCFVIGLRQINPDHYIHQSPPQTLDTGLGGYHEV